MTITLDPLQEQAVLAAIRAGLFRSVDEFINAAIATLPNVAAVSALPSVPATTSGLWELRKGLSLGEVPIKELVEEGRVEL